MPSLLPRILMSYRFFCFFLAQMGIVYPKHEINYLCDEYLRCIRGSVGGVFTHFGPRIIVFAESVLYASLCRVLIHKACSLFAY